MLHGNDVADGPSSFGLSNGQPAFFRTTSRASSGNFGSLSTNDSFPYEPHWWQADTIPDYPSDDEMVSQVKRLESFRNWPSSCPVKPKELAAAGFYYTQLCDRVRCFRCNLTLQNWQAGENPWEEHQRLGPRCPFLRENAAVNQTEPAIHQNYGDRDQSLGRMASETAPALHSFPVDTQPSLSRLSSSQSGADLVGFGTASLRHETGLSETSMAPPSGYYGYREQRYPYESVEQSVEFARENASFHSQGSERSMNSPSFRLPAEQSRAEHGRTTRLVGEQRVFSLPPGSQLSISSGGMGTIRMTSQPPQGAAARLPAEVTPPISSTSQGSHVSTSHAGRTRREGAWSPVSGPSAVSTNRQRPRQMANVAYPVVDPTLEEGSGPLFRREDARHVTTYAELASEHHRLTTFVDWPQDSTVHPWELSVAGFYYVGTGDSVKCFKCGVELANWEPEDTPWGEHQRWSPHCPFVVEHFRGRTQIAPVESTGSPVMRRSSGHSWSAATVSSSNEPAVPHATFSSGAPNFRGGETIVNPTFNHSGPRSLGRQEVSSPSEAPSGSSEMTPLSVANQPPGSSDVDRLVGMGFARDLVTQEIRRKISSTGTNFGSFDELLEALLTGRSPATLRSPPTTPPFPAPSSLPALPLENEEIPPGMSAPTPTGSSFLIEGLRRTMSEPQSGYSGGAEGEKDESLQQKLDRMQEERTCKICMDAEVGVVFLPCGHLSCCPRCAAGMQQCPMCRRPIQEKIRTYLS